MTKIEELQNELSALKGENVVLRENPHQNAPEKTVFQTLNEYDITEHLKNKNNIIYLPWSKAWTIIKTLYPDSVIKTWENEDFDGDERRYFTDGKTAWVKVSITIDGHTETECLAVMDLRNKSIPLDSITSADVEKSIKRCFVKCAALHGLGLSLWTGEELSSAARKKKEDDLKSIKNDILSAITEKLDAGVAREQIYKVLETTAGVKNPNAIKDIETAKKVINKIRKLDVKNAQ